MVGEDEKAKTSTAPGLYVSGPQSAREPARAAGQPPAAVASARGSTEGRWPEAVRAIVRQKRERGLGAPARPLPTDRERQV